MNPPLPPVYKVKMEVHDVAPCYDPPLPILAITVCMPAAPGVAISQRIVMVPSRNGNLDYVIRYRNLPESIKPIDLAGLNGCVVMARDFLTPLVVATFQRATAARGVRERP
jgi:hypothetical protein